MANSSYESLDDFLAGYIFPLPTEWFFVVIYIIVFFGGIFGNLLVCYAVWRNKVLHSFTNSFIVNLAIADALVLVFCLPTSLLSDVTETWFLGAVMCKVVVLIQDTSVSVSVLTLGVISMERWMAICMPLKFTATRGRAVKILVAVWIISTAISTPEYFYMALKPSPSNTSILLTGCHIPNEYKYSAKVFRIVFAVFLYIIPAALLSVFYTMIIRVLWRSAVPPGVRTVGTPNNDETVHARQRAAVMLLVVVIAFYVCYFPVHMLGFLRYFGILEKWASSAPKTVVNLALTSHWLCYFNSSINPIIYTIMSSNFRRAFRRSFPCLSVGQTTKCGKQWNYVGVSKTVTDHISMNTMEMERLS